MGSPLYKIDCDSVQTEAAATTVSTTTAAPPAPAAISAPTSQKVVVNVPIMGESITTGVLAKWLCKAGEAVSVDQVVASIETDKVCGGALSDDDCLLEVRAVTIKLHCTQVTVDVRSPHEGVVTKLLAEEGKEVQVDQPLLEVQPQKLGTPAAVAAVKTVPTPSAPVADAVKAPVKAAASESATKAAPKAAVAAPAASAQKTPVGHRSETRVKMTRMRLRIAQRLKDSQNTAAMLTTFQEVDMTALMELRTRYKDDFEKVHGVKLGFMSAFVRVRFKLFSTW